MLKDLTEELEGIIERKAKELINENTEALESYDYLRESLEGMITEAKDLKADMDNNNLTASGIEAEGYLRFALNVEALLAG